MSEYREEASLNVELCRPNEQDLQRARQENILGTSGLKKIIRCLNRKQPLDEDIQTEVNEHFRGWNIEDFKKLLDLYLERPNQGTLDQITRALGLPQGSSKDRIIEIIRSL
jgi:hypothetical protein